MRVVIWASNKLLSWTYLLKTLQFRSASRAIARCQENKLLSILRRNEETAYGAEYQFGSITSRKDFQTHIPLSDYESVKPWIERIMAGELNMLTAVMHI